MMKLNVILTLCRRSLFAVFVLLLLSTNKLTAQICASPSTTIYGLTSSGAIYPITVSNAAVGTVVKNSTYSGNSANKANGLAYNSTNGKFYYFKRNVGTTPQEFISYDPATAIVTILATSTCNSEVHTGCITANGLYYYTIDIDANLNVYNILTNQWTKITSSFTDQNGNNVSNIIKSQNAGDIAFDGNGNLWIVTSSSTNFGVYKLPAPIPTTSVAGVTVSKIVDPTTSTPSGNMVAGIAFSPSGQIFMSTKNDERLYRLENNLSLTYLGTFSVSDVGNDLTSCAFPLGVLPVTWVDFTATLKSENRVELNWQIAEKYYNGFSVQHSIDGTNWKDLAFIEIKSEDLEGQQYIYSHASPAPGRNYYRIRAKSESGKESISEVKMAMIKLPGSVLSLWPNPASGSINITGGGYSTKQVRLYDLAGSLRYEKQLFADENTVNISSLKPGCYLLNIYTQDGVSHSQKFMKQ